VRIALAQLNTVVGDIGGNARRIGEAIERAAAAGAGITLVPELAISGYPPEDLLLRPDFAAASRAALDEVAAGVTRGAALIGFPEWSGPGGDVHNSAALVADGRVQAVYRKRFLPNYGVFDEDRYFSAGDRPIVLELLGARVGVGICEAIWYSEPVAGDLAAGRLDLICCLSSSPYHQGKADWRERMLGTRAGDSHAALAFCNQVGGQDELVFDGRSVVFDAYGELVARAGQFAEELLIADVDLEMAARRRLREPLARRLGGEPPPALPVAAALPGDASANGRLNVIAATLDAPAELWSALVTGLRDYVDKNGFRTVVLGLSGGIDSALVATVAVDALGSERVVGVAMPSRHSSPDSLGDAQALAESLGIRLETIPIGPVVGPVRGRAGGALRRPPRRHHGGEPAGARARHPPDGPLQQVRLAGAGDRQQERDLGRLQHPVRGHGGRVRAHPRPVQDMGVSTRAVAQRVRGPGAHPAAHHRAAALRGARARTARHGPPSAI
jgi:NAD+ synthase (glutamine-hydrolysing)